MKYVLIIHEVENYEKWKAVFDASTAIRKQAGELTYNLLKYQAKKNKIVHFSEWTSLEAGKAFFESELLVKIRQDAGVKAPEFIYLDQIEKGIL